MKKILQISKFFTPVSGGVENVVFSICTYYKENSRVQMTVWCHEYKRKKLKSKKDHFNGFKVYRERILFKILSQPLTLNFKKLKSLIKKNEIIHLHFPLPSLELYLLLNSSLLNNKKLIITYHANPAYTRWGRINFLYRIIYKKLFLKADVIIFTDKINKTASKLKSNILGKSKIIPPIVQKNTLTNQKSIPKKDIDILIVGKLRKYKGHRYLIEAIKSTPYRLIIIGNGEEYQKILKQIKSQGLCDQIQIITDCDNYTLTNYYMRSKILALPSINESEAFGIVQLEAMSYGLPIINTNLNSGVRSVSIDGETGITVEPKNVLQLRQAITKIIEDPLLYNYFSNNCIERVKKYDPKNIMPLYDPVYLTEH